MSKISTVSVIIAYIKQILTLFYLSALVKLKPELKLVSHLLQTRTSSKKLAMLHCMGTVTNNKEAVRASM